MKNWTIVIVALPLLGALGLNMTWGANRIWPVGAGALAQKVTAADAILVATVGEVQAKRYEVRVLQKDTGGTQVAMSSFYDLAVLHPETVLKLGHATMINKADASNPVDFMSVAFRSPGGAGVSEMHEEAPGWQTGATKGDRKIWFLRRDALLTGSYFIAEAQDVSAARVEEIKKLVEASTKVPATR